MTVLAHLENEDTFHYLADRHNARKFLEYRINAIKVHNMLPGASKERQAHLDTSCRILGNSWSKGQAWPGIPYILDRILGCLESAAMKGKTR